MEKKNRSDNTETANNPIMETYEKIQKLLEQKNDLSKQIKTINLKIAQIETSITNAKANNELLKGTGLSEIILNNNRMLTSLEEAIKEQKSQEEKLNNEKKQLEEQIETEKEKLKNIPKIIEEKEQELNDLNKVNEKYLSAEGKQAKQTLTEEIELLKNMPQETKNKINELLGKPKENNEEPLKENNKHNSKEPTKTELQPVKTLDLNPQYTETTKEPLQSNGVMPFSRELPISTLNMNPQRLVNTQTLDPTGPQNDIIDNDEEIDSFNNETPQEPVKTVPYVVDPNPNNKQKTNKEPAMASSEQTGQTEQDDQNKDISEIFATPPKIDSSFNSIDVPIPNSNDLITSQDSSKEPPKPVAPIEPPKPVATSVPPTEPPKPVATSVPPIEAPKPVSPQDSSEDKWDALKKFIDENSLKTPIAPKEPSPEPDLPHKLVTDEDDKIDELPPTEPPKPVATSVPPIEPTKPTSVEELTADDIIAALYAERDKLEQQSLQQESEDLGRIERKVKRPSPISNVLGKFKRALESLANNLSKGAK